MLVKLYCPYLLHLTLYIVWILMLTHTVRFNIKSNIYLVTEEYWIENTDISLNI